MKFELKSFQTTSAQKIIEELADAREGARKGKLEAVVLSAPTGSGKTITVAAVIDWLFGGADGIEARPQTTFLWLSDSPELNQQSKGKLMAACDNVPFNVLETIDSQEFDQPTLSPGHVYFINTQLLGKDKLLTKGGDKKSYTFWQTVQNTINERPEDLILIIDEAHRGAGVSDRARKPIMQKFITGSEEDGLSPVPIVLGMSATPQRFTELLGNTQRIQRPVNITPEMVRSSGLLKDLIQVTTNKGTTIQSDLTHLQTAAARWKESRNQWETYCNKSGEKETVKPVLVVQVQDGNDRTLTATPLDDVVKVIQKETGPLAVNEIVHCFQDKEEIEYGGCIIRKMEASRIQDATDVKIVLFKTALTTGWDCPRAEVMMSFRKSVDATTIAQLVGRMIRTPLARRIEADESLNVVDLFLPHYDAGNLEAVLASLRNPDAHEGVPSEVTTSAAAYPRNPTFADVFKHLSGIKHYSVGRAPKMSDLKRLLRLSGQLTLDGIDAEADDKTRAKLVEKLRDLRDKYAKTVKNWKMLVQETGEVAVEVSAVAIGPMSITGRTAATLALSEENIDHLFDAAGRTLAAGEGLHRDYWKKYGTGEASNETKLEVAAVIRQPNALDQMNKLAAVEFEKLWNANHAAIQVLPAAEKARFKLMKMASGIAEEMDWELPETIVEKTGNHSWQKHLYADTGGNFSTNLNGWESAFLEWTKQQPDFHCWLRNFPNREWSFCIPYENGGLKAFYPDFLIVRKQGKGYVVDILEPHDTSRKDTWAKVKGMAEFADKHGTSFGRLMLGRKSGTTLEVVDVNNTKIRAKARKMGAPADLESLFEEV
jgi:type III restriction enzyme